MFPTLAHEYLVFDTFAYRVDTIRPYQKPDKRGKWSMRLIVLDM